MSTPKERLKPPKQFQVITVLIDLEDGADDAATSVANRWMRSNTHTEAAFSIHETRNVFGRQILRSSLLIVRTGQIFTVHVNTLGTRCDTNEYCRILGCSSK
jgi:hypothetical protein